MWNEGFSVVFLPVIILQYDGVALGLVNVDSWFAISDDNGDIRYVRSLAELRAVAGGVGKC